jgi:hypothetical protein
VLLCALRNAMTDTGVVAAFAVTPPETGDPMLAPEDAIVNVIWSPAFKSERFEARKVNVLLRSSTLTIVPLNCFAAAELALELELPVDEVELGEELELGYELELDEELDFGELPDVAEPRP